MRIVSCLLLCLASLVAAAPPETAIRAVLNAQVEAWNRGDIPAFMDGYDRSDRTLFVGKDIAHGWQQVLDRYRKTYSNKEQMGTLRFEIEQVDRLGSNYANVVGRFFLARSAAAGGDASGVFTLLFEKKNGAWKIVQDHTS